MNFTFICKKLAIIRVSCMEMPLLIIATPEKKLRHFSLETGSIWMTIGLTVKHIGENKSVTMATVNNSRACPKALSKEYMPEQIQRLPV